MPKVSTTKGIATTSASTEASPPPPPSSSSLMLLRRRILVSGRVQGVFYRRYAQRTADKLGVTGWVCNLRDGRVQLMAEGTAEQLDLLVQWCHKGSPHSRVEDVVVEDIPMEEGDKEGNESTSGQRRYDTFMITHL